MEKLVLVYMDGYDEVLNFNTQELVFSTRLNKEQTELLGRDKIDENVIDNVVNIFNEKGIEELDDYLLDEGKCSQDEREIIIESIYNYTNK